MHTNGVGKCLEGGPCLYVMHALYVMSTPAHTVEESVLTICLRHCDFLDVVGFYLVVKVTVIFIIHHLSKQSDQCY